jgi:hypothetical protein
MNLSVRRMGGSEFGLSGLDVAAVVFYFALILGIGMWVSLEHSCSYLYILNPDMEITKNKNPLLGYTFSIDFKIHILGYGFLSQSPRLEITNIWQKSQDFFS